MKNHPLKNDKFRTILGIILAVLAFVVVQVLISTGTLTSYYQDIVFLMCINIIMAVSLNLITGFTGQFSLGHAGFMAIGAYVCALVIMELNTPFAFIIGIFAGAFFCRHRRLSHWLPHPSFER